MFDFTDKEIYIMKRKHRKIKALDVARHLEVTSAMISIYENGKGNMSPENVRKYKSFIDGE